MLPKNTKLKIDQYNKIHNNKYKYKKVYYVGSRRYLTIFCPTHGYFNQREDGHLNGAGCKACGIENRITTPKQFLKKAKKQHKNKYKYDLKSYKDTNSYLNITCDKHGQFKQRASSHLAGTGCPKCARDKHSSYMRKDEETFIKKANIVHNNFYSYDKCVYEIGSKKVIITCPIHGNFKQTPDSHLRGNRCFRCNKVTKRSKGESIIEAYLKKNNFKYELEYKFQPGNQYRYDFHLVDLDILIEFDGRQHYVASDYYGGEDKLKKRKEADRDKTILAFLYGKDLIRIPYYQLNNIENILSHEIKKRFPYKVGDLYFKSFIDLARKFNLPDHATIDNYKTLIKKENNENDRNKG